jgi:hypothetical protein
MEMQYIVVAVVVVAFILFGASRKRNKRSDVPRNGDGSGEVLPPKQEK